MRCDLHIHSTASDGAYSPSQLVKMALAKGLGAISLTDHDSTEGIDLALQAAQGTPLEVIPGVEISAEVGSEEAHILGYYIDHHYEPLQERLRAIRDFRRHRAWKMIERLKDLGMPLSRKRVAEIAGEGSMGRPHIARAMMEKGYVSSTSEAFVNYIGRNGPAYVSRYKITPLGATKMILEAGGLPVLAHPLEVLGLLPELACAGLVGLEAYYGQYSPEQSQDLARWAKKYGLITTGGSDFHGPGILETPALGEVSIPEEVVPRLQALKRSRA
ncbi:MAG: PHP domain-containing protein [Anaerolineae bacterium]